MAKVGAPVGAQDQQIIDDRFEKVALVNTESKKKCCFRLYMLKTLFLVLIY